jgi:hypothetical protein
MPDEIPDDLRDFIVQQIDSIAQLEALLLLRDTPHESWDSNRIAARLYINEGESARILGSLHQNGFLKLSADGNSYSYACGTEELGAMVTRLAQFYRRKLIPVTNLIHSKQKRIQQFADAFRLRKES